MKILLPVDGSSYTTKALQYIETHADLFGGAHEYIILHVPFALPARAAAVAGHDAVKKLHEEETAEATREARAFFDKKGWNYRLLSHAGEPGPTIGRFAREQGVDMVIMGTHGRGTLGSLMLGSVAQRVLAECTTPVLLIR